MKEKRPLFFSLRFRMLTLYGGLFIAFFAATIYIEMFGLPVVGVGGDFANQRGETINVLNLAADLKKERFASWLQEREGDCQALANNIVIQRYAERMAPTIQKLGENNLEQKNALSLIRKDKDVDEVTSILLGVVSAFKLVGFYNNAKIIDGKTGIIIASLIPEMLGGNISKEEYFRTPLKTGRMFIGIGARQKEHEPELYISVPTKTAVIAMSINPEAIFQTLSETGNALGKTGDVVLVDGEGVILTPLRFPLPGGVTAKPLKFRITAAPARLAISGKDGSLEAKDYRGVKVLAAARGLPLTGQKPWGIVVKQDYSEVMKDEYSAVFLKFTLNLLALLIILAISFWLSKTLSSSIENIGKVAEEVEKGNYSVRAATSAAGEEGLLAKRINSMIVGIQEQNKKLENEIRERKNAENETRELNRELDDRVRRRTAALAAANKELEAFSYSVSHDLRAPLRGIDGFSLALVEDYGTVLDAKGRDYLKRIRAGTLRMGGLIDDILKLSHITRDEMRVEEVNLSELAVSVVEELKKQDPERNVEFIIGDGYVVNGDSKLLGVALENLLGNAWKFTVRTPKAKIEFGAMEVNGERVFFVRDNGAGFDMAYKEMLFTPFHRLHTNEEFEGSGIGLATVKRIFARHGGRVWGEGEVDKGAIFYFVI